MMLYQSVWCSKSKHMCNNLRMLTLNSNLCYIENEDTINCTIQILNTYVTILFMQLNKERYKIIILPTNY
jgi:hypothetical protein